MILVGQLAGRDLAFYCFNFDGCTMFVAARYHNNVFTFEAEIAGVYVCGD